MHFRNNLNSSTFSHQGHAMFWSKKSDTTVPAPETKDDDSHTSAKENDTELGQMESMINDVLKDGKKGSSTLRDKASSRAESLELNKFPVCFPSFLVLTTYYLKIIY